jgi:hypothetical protein
MNTQSVAPLPGPLLVIPVYNGGDFLHRCLISVKRSSHFFSRIVISLNGDHAGRDKQIVLSELAAYNNVVLLETPRKLNPISHLAWIADQLKEMPRTQRVFLLAHDDELEDDALGEWCAKLTGYPSLLAWIGPYNVCLNASESVMINSAPTYTAPPCMTPQDWLARYAATPASTVYTNMSGISVPLGVFSDVVRFFRQTLGRKGLRFELMMLTHAAVEGVAAYSRPLVVIHEHPSQEGKNVFRCDWYSDEIRCCAWLLGNSASSNGFARVFFGPWGAVHLCGSAARLVREWCITLFTRRVRKWH